MKRFTLTILTMGLLFLSCKKSHISPEKYFIFGISYGECIDDCATFYLISKGKLYPDSVQYRSNSTELQFKSMALSNEKYLQAKKLMDNFPTYLKKNPDKTLGCPDCHDQGAIYIKLNENGNSRTWNIDPANHPDEIKEFIQELNSVMSQLRI